MDIISAIFIGAGATIGVLMLTHLLKGHHIPKALTFIHGFLVVTGLLLLIIYNLNAPHFANWTSVVFFALAAIGGLYILQIDIKHKKVPLAVAFFHGGIAVSGFLIMIFKIKNHF